LPLPLAPGQETACLEDRRDGETKDGREEGKDKKYAALACLLEMSF